MAVKERMDALLAARLKARGNMHPIARTLLWLAILALILFSETIIPKSEQVMRTCGALTFLLWLLVGAAWFLRGMYRFIVSR